MPEQIPSPKKQERILYAVGSKVRVASDAPLLQLQDGQLVLGKGTLKAGEVCEVLDWGSSEMALHVKSLETNAVGWARCLCPVTRKNVFHPVVEVGKGSLDQAAQILKRELGEGPKIFVMAPHQWSGDPDEGAFKTLAKHLSTWAKDGAVLFTGCNSLSMNFLGHHCDERVRLVNILPNDGQTPCSEYQGDVVLVDGDVERRDQLCALLGDCYLSFDGCDAEQTLRMAAERGAPVLGLRMGEEFSQSANHRRLVAKEMDRTEIICQIFNLLDNHKSAGGARGYLDSEKFKLFAHKRKFSGDQMEWDSYFKALCRVMGWKSPQVDMDHFVGWLDVGAFRVETKELHRILIELQKDAGSEYEVARSASAFVQEITPAQRNEMVEHAFELLDENKNRWLDSQEFRVFADLTCCEDDDEQWERTFAALAIHSEGVDLNWWKDFVNRPDSLGFHTDYEIQVLLEALLENEAIAERCGTKQDLNHIRSATLPGQASGGNVYRELRKTTTASHSEQYYSYFRTEAFWQEQEFSAHAPETRHERHRLVQTTLPLPSQQVAKNLTSRTAMRNCDRPDLQPGEICGICGLYHKLRACTGRDETRNNANPSLSRNSNSSQTIRFLEERVKALDLDLLMKARMGKSVDSTIAQELQKKKGSEAAVVRQGDPVIAKKVATQKSTKAQGNRTADQLAQQTIHLQWLSAGTANEIGGLHMNQIGSHQQYGIKKDGLQASSDKVRKKTEDAQLHLHMPEIVHHEERHEHDVRISQEVAWAAKHYSDQLASTRVTDNSVSADSDGSFGTPEGHQGMTMGNITKRIGGPEENDGADRDGLNGLKDSWLADSHWYDVRYSSEGDRAGQSNMYVDEHRLHEEIQQELFNEEPYHEYLRQERYYCEEHIYKKRDLATLKPVEKVELDIRQTIVRHCSDLMHKKVLIDSLQSDTDLEPKKAIADKGCKKEEVLQFRWDKKENIDLTHNSHVDNHLQARTNDKRTIDAQLLNIQKEEIDMTKWKYVDKSDMVHKIEVVSEIIPVTRIDEPMLISNIEKKEHEIRQWSVVEPGYLEYQARFDGELQERTPQKITTHIETSSPKQEIAITMPAKVVPTTLQHGMKKDGGIQTPDQVRMPALISQSAPKQEHVSKHVLAMVPGDLQFASIKDGGIISKTVEKAVIRITPEVPKEQHYPLKWADPSAELPLTFASKLNGNLLAQEYTKNVYIMPAEVQKQWYEKSCETHSQAEALKSHSKMDGDVMRWVPERQAIAVKPTVQRRAHETPRVSILPGRTLLTCSKFDGGFAVKPPIKQTAVVSPSVKKKEYEVQKAAPEQKTECLKIVSKADGEYQIKDQMRQTALVNSIVFKQEQHKTVQSSNPPTFLTAHAKMQGSYQMNLPSKQPAFVSPVVQKQEYEKPSSVLPVFGNLKNSSKMDGAFQVKEQVKTTAVVEPAVSKTEHNRQVSLLVSAFSLKDTAKKDGDLQVNTPKETVLATPTLARQERPISTYLPCHPTSLDVKSKIDGKHETSDPLKLIALLPSTVPKQEHIKTPRPLIPVGDLEYKSKTPGTLQVADTVKKTCLMDTAVPKQGCEKLGYIAVPTVELNSFDKIDGALQVADIMKKAVTVDSLVQKQCPQAPKWSIAIPPSCLQCSSKHDAGFLYAKMAPVTKTIAPEVPRTQSETLRWSLLAAPACLNYTSPQLGGLQLGVKPKELALVTPNASKLDHAKTVDMHSIGESLNLTSRIDGKMQSASIMKKTVQVGSDISKQPYDKIAWSYATLSDVKFFSKLGGDMQLDNPKKHTAGVVSTASKVMYDCAPKWFTTYKHELHSKSKVDNGMQKPTLPKAAIRVNAGPSKQQYEPMKETPLHPVPLTYNSNIPSKMQDAPLKKIDAIIPTQVVTKEQYALKFTSTATGNLMHFARRDGDLQHATLPRQTILELEQEKAVQLNMVNVDVSKRERSQAKWSTRIQTGNVMLSHNSDRQLQKHTDEYHNKNLMTTLVRKEEHISRWSACESSAVHHKNVLDCELHIKPYEAAEFLGDGGASRVQSKAAAELGQSPRKSGQYWHKLETAENVHNVNFVPDRSELEKIYSEDFAKKNKEGGSKTYIVDNVLLKTFDESGVRYRRSIRDTDMHPSLRAKWGDVVEGSARNGHWLAVPDEEGSGELFLPMLVDGIQVVFPVTQPRGNSEIIKEGWLSDGRYNQDAKAHTEVEYGREDQRWCVARRGWLEVYPNPAKRILSEVIPLRLDTKIVHADNLHIVIENDDTFKRSFLTISDIDLADWIRSLQKARSSEDAAHVPPAKGYSTKMSKSFNSRERSRSNRSRARSTHSGSEISPSDALTNVATGAWEYVVVSAGAVAVHDSPMQEWNPKLKTLPKGRLVKVIERGTLEDAVWLRSSGGWCRERTSGRDLAEIGYEELDRQYLASAQAVNSRLTKPLPLYPAPCPGKEKSCELVAGMGVLVKNQARVLMQFCSESKAETWRVFIHVVAQENPSLNGWTAVTLPGGESAIEAVQIQGLASKWVLSVKDKHPIYKHPGLASATKDILWRGSFKKVKESQKIGNVLFYKLSENQGWVTERDENGKRAVEIITRESHTHIYNVIARGGTDSKELPTREENCRVLANIPENKKVLVTERAFNATDDVWYRIKAPSMGWVSEKHLQTGELQLRKEMAIEGGEIDAVHVWENASSSSFRAERRTFHSQQGLTVLANGIKTQTADANGVLLTTGVHEDGPALMLSSAKGVKEYGKRSSI